MPLVNPNPIPLASWAPVLLLGALSLYLLLPRPRRLVHPAIGGALGLASLGWAVAVLGRHGPTAHPEAVLFYSFSGLALLGAAALVTQRNPARAAISFALVVLSTCGLFLIQGAPFLTAATVVIYAGAIVVTFLFVLMLAHQGGPSDADDRSREPLLSCVVGTLLLAALLALPYVPYRYPGLEQLLARAEHAEKQKTPAAMYEALGGRDRYLIQVRRVARMLESASAPQKLTNELTDLEEQLNSPKPDDELTRAQLQRFVGEGRKLAPRSSRFGGPFEAEA